MRLSEAIRLFIKDSELRLSKKSRDLYDDDLRLFYGWAMAHVSDSVLAFDAALIRRFLLSLSAKGLSMATIARRRASLAELSRYGFRERFWATNHIDAVDRVRRPKTKPKPFTAEEGRRLMALTLTGRDRVIRAILYYAGFRVSELITARVGDFASEARTLRTRGKGDKDRVVPVAIEGAQILEDWILHQTDLHPASYLFRRGVGGHISAQDVRYLCEKWGRRADVVQCTPHRWRHLYASTLLARGASLRAIQLLLGHESLATTAGYLAVADRQLREVADLLSDHQITTLNVIQDDDPGAT